MTIFNRDLSISENICQLLLSNGADPNFKNNELWSPIHLAVRKGQLDSLKFMVRYNK